MTLVYLPPFPSQERFARAMVAETLVPTFPHSHYFRAQIGQSDRAANVLMVNAPNQKTAREIVFSKTASQTIVIESAKTDEIATRLRRNELGAFLIYRGEDAQGRIVANNVLKRLTKTALSVFTSNSKRTVMAAFFGNCFPHQETPETIRPEVLGKLFARRSDGIFVMKPTMEAIYIR